MAEMFLQIPLEKYFELNHFCLKLFEVVSEEIYEEDGTLIATDGFSQFLQEIENRSKNKRLLPVQMELLAQFAASLILHLEAELALPTLKECFRCEMTPWLYYSYFNPEAESKAIQLRQEPIQVLIRSIQTLIYGHQR